MYSDVLQKENLDGSSNGVDEAREKGYRCGGGWASGGKWSYGAHRMKVIDCREGLVSAAGGTDRYVYRLELNTYYGGMRQKPEEIWTFSKAQIGFT